MTGVVKSLQLGRPPYYLKRERGKSVIRSVSIPRERERKREREESLFVFNYNLAQNILSLLLGFQDEARASNLTTGYR